MFLVVGASRADVTLSDGNYAFVDWATSIVTASGGAAQNTTLSTIGGNPGAYRKTVLTLPAGASIATAHLYQGGSYNPAVDGAIYALDYDEDQIQETPPFPGAFIEATPLLEQGGVLYVGPDITFTNTAWSSLVRNNLVTDLDVSGNNVTEDHNTILQESDFAAYFVDASNWDLHLLPNAPALDQGKSVAA